MAVKHLLSAHLRKRWLAAKHPLAAPLPVKLLAVKHLLLAHRVVGARVVEFPKITP